MNVLVLLSESLEILVSDYLLKENLEFPLDFVKLIRLHPHCLDLLLELLLVLDRFVVDVAVLVSQFSHLNSSYIIYC